MQSEQDVLMNGGLCRTLTRDGLELVGFGSIPADARTGLVHIHGLDGNFYENRFVDSAAEACGKAGYAFVSGNTRGHDYIADLIRVDPGSAELGSVQVGGMYERLRDSAEDVRAWTEWLREQGCERVILQGHSHGAIKVLHYLFTSNDPAVCGLVLLSPSDDFGLARLRLGERFDEAVELATRMVREGRDRDMMPGEFFPYPTSAGTFLDTLGPDSVALAFNLSRTDRTSFPELNSVRVPVLLVVGTVEEAFVQTPEQYAAAIGQELTSAPSFESVMVRDAPHNYLGHEAEVGAALGRWLEDRNRG